MEHRDLVESSPYALVDSVYQNFLERHPNTPERWLLSQTLYTAAARRGIFGFLPLTDGARVLDIGTGFGALAFDLATYKSIEVYGVDVNRITLSAAQEIYSQLRQLGAFKQGSSITFSEDSAYQLSFEDSTFDFVIARYVFQHLDEPVSAMNEIKRVLKPGAFICLVDIDDQMVITYPEDLAFRKLSEAFRELQVRRGGDRFVGRKLSTYMNQVGLEVLGNIIQPEAQFAAYAQGDIASKLTIARFSEVRSDIVDLGIMKADQFDACLNSYIEGIGELQYQANANFITVGRKSSS
ncbi:methyltransferase domain-containing protein [Alicyclobacillus fastidiosus]|uniref:Methyltransferase domain-containing protein n=1 Tax=Alicyclobacillus fastidiosus TaxID=392011 RepID=A0ABY6ZKL2_9BACL|nr:methyltransferase domain-containing protein [Alicyclobacillus fastidiosus]WAH42641.1 methyltransferase domain-containing protein [Alicyclobacillus fastidiosus]GMA64515.1 hypothetical protein GCM10025859_49550 [Alicyclobacillus fastidiosus]